MKQTNNRKEIFLVPYSHLDTQWRWEYPTTINKYLKNTIDESLYMFEKYDHHRFNFTGAIRYRMMSDYYPDKFEKVKELVKQDRWSLAGTCLDETDSLVPSVESNVRNILYGDQWQKETFGKSSRDYMIPDCFGFPVNLPTVMNHCGIHGFSSNKLTWGSAVGVPFEIGMWQGPDGSEIVSVFNPCRYDSHLELPVHLNPGRQARLKRLGERNGIWKSFQYYGVGDIGGSPLESSVINAKRSMDYFKNKESDVIVRQGSADEFFSDISDEEKAKMDRYQGDLLLTQHSAGTITSATIMKRWNRKNEQMAFAAEAAAVMAMEISDIPYPYEKINAAWERVCGSQMHDILPGTSTPLAYEYAQNDEVIALNTWDTILNDSAKAIAPYVAGDGSVMLFNGIELKRHELVDLVLDGVSLDKSYEMKDAFDHHYPLQLRLENNQIVGTFKPELEPFSWVRYELIETNKEVSEDVTLVDKGDVYILRNKYYKVMVTKEGSVSSIRDLVRSRELLEKPLAYELQKERPMKFPAWNMDWRDRKKKPYLSIYKGGQVEVIEDGQLRKTLKITIKYNESIFIKEVSLSHESDLVEFKERIDWHETGCSFKLALHTTMDQPTATYNWETARMERGINNKKQYEVPSRMWVDLSQDDFGFSLVEDSKYGYDRPDESTLRMTLIYTPALRYTNGFWDQKSHDFGHHTVRYGIKSHDGSWNGTDVIARKFNQGVRAFRVEGIASENSEVTEWAKIESSQVGVTAIKKAEESDEVLVRLYERHGEDVITKIKFPSPIKEAVVVNGLEEVIDTAQFEGSELNVSLIANGLKAYKLKFESSDEPSKNMEYKSLSLPFNYALMGSNHEKGTARIPRELTPKAISAGNIKYDLAVDESMNALKTSGQVIEIDTKTNQLSLLTTADEDTLVSYTWLDEGDNVLCVEQLTVPSITGFRGLWDTRLWKKKPKHHLKNQRDYAWLNKCVGIKPGFIKRDRIEWYVTHTHEDGIDQPYQYGYLYGMSLRIPQGAKKLMLPMESTYVLSAVCHNESIHVSSAQYLYDQYDI